MMLGELQDTDIDLDVIFNTTKFVGESSGAAEIEIKMFLNVANIEYPTNQYTS